MTQALGRSIPGVETVVALGIAICLVTAMPAAHAQVYKWVDANGKVQYSDAPPPTVKKTEVVKGAAAASKPPAGPADWQEKDREFRSRKIVQEEIRRKEEEETQMVKQKRTKACLQAQEQIDDLTAGVPIYRMNTKGERVYMDDAERASNLKEARQSAAENCRP